MRKSDKKERKKKQKFDEKEQNEIFLYSKGFSMFFVIVNFPFSYYDQ